MALNSIFKSLFQNIWFSNKINLIQLQDQVFYNIIHSKLALVGSLNGYYPRFTQVRRKECHHGGS